MIKKIKVTEYNFSVLGIEPTVFALVSDLHDFSNEPVLDIVDNIGADAVLIPGDFIHSSSVYERGIEFLRVSSQKRPTFCSLGNHEMKFDGDIKALVKDTGAVLLDNESCVFTKVPRSYPRPACPPDRETFARRRRETPRSADAPQHGWCQRQGRIFPSRKAP